MKPCFTYETGKENLGTYPHKVRKDDLSYRQIKHLVAPDDLAGCYECHKKATPKISQDWNDSKHGVVLMKCFVCHGEPGGQGSVPFAVVPKADEVCMKCHDPAMQRMREKYGLEANCYECHPFHQNSLHHKAYSKSVSKKSL